MGDATFVQAQISGLDATTNLDTAVDSVNAIQSANGLPGNWTAEDTTLAVIILSVLASMFADVATVSATVLPAIFRAFGTQLFGIPYGNGVASQVVTLWTYTGAAPDSVSFFIPSGTAVIVDGIAFYTTSDYTAAMGDLTATLTLSSQVAGASYDGLGGVNVPVQLSQQFDWVASIVTTGVSAGGSDPQTDDAYQDALTSELQLQAPRPVVYPDFAQFLLSNSAAAVAGVQVGRAISFDMMVPDGRALSIGGGSTTAITASTTNGSALVNYTSLGGQAPAVGATVTGTGIPALATVAASPAPTDTTFSLSANATATGTPTLSVSAVTGWGRQGHVAAVCNITNASAAVTITTPPDGSLGAIPAVGSRVVGAGVPLGAVVLASPTPTAAGFTMSANATASTTGVSLTVSSWTSFALANSSIVTDVEGNPLTATQLDALQGWLETYRPTNWRVNVTSAVYNTVYVTALVKIAIGFDPTATAAAVQSALMGWLSPLGWASSESQQLTTVQNTIKYKEAIAVAGNVAGVVYVDTLTIGLSPSPAGVVDVTMTGLVALPQSTVSTILVTTE